MNLKRTFLSLGVIGLLISSCAEKKDGEQKTTLLSNFVSITDNEDKGVKEILAFYGGYCKYAVGVSVSTDKGKSKYFELEMSKSEVINNLSDNAQLPASNVAYLFYKNLKAEKENYKEIHTVIVFENGSKKKFVFPTDKLEIVEGRMKSVEHIVSLIQAKDFDGIKPFLNDTSLIVYDKNRLVTNMEKMDDTFGTVKEFLPYGFRLDELKNGKKGLRISGAILRDKQSHEFSASFDLDAPENELLMVEYKL